MNNTVVGMAVGAVLAFSILTFNFWGFVLVVVFMALGLLVGRVMDGRLNLSQLADALRGRRSSS